MLRWVLCLTIAAAAVPAGAAEVRACGTAVPVSVDAASFASAGRDASQARLDRIAGEVAALFQAEALKLCEGDFLGAQDFVAVQGLLVQNGEGAAEPAIHRAGARPGMLVFQYAFATGGAPAAAQVEQALRCWRRPDVEGCYED